MGISTFYHHSRDKLLEFRTSFYDWQLAMISLSKGISSTLNFYESIVTDGTQTRNISHHKWALYQLS